MGDRLKSPLERGEGLQHDSVVNCDHLVLIPKSALTNYVGALGAKRIAEPRRALRVALAVE